MKFTSSLHSGLYKRSEQTDPLHARHERRGQRIRADPVEQTVYPGENRQQRGSAVHTMSEERHRDRCGSVLQGRE